MLEGYADVRPPGRIKVDDVNSVEKVRYRRLQFG